MKVLYFTRDYSPHDARFLNFLSQTEHQVYLLRLEGTAGKGNDRNLQANITEIDWLGGKRPQTWIDYPALQIDLQRVIKKIQPDLIHAGPIQKVASLVAQAGFSPLVSMSWGSDLLHDASSSSWMRWITHYTLQRTSVMIGDCKAVADKAEEFGLSKKNMVLFPWGVDLKYFSPGPADIIRKQLGWEKNFVILSTRSWEPIYGVDLLVSSFAMAVEKEPGLRLLIQGQGSQEKEIKKLVEKSNVEQKVHFGGTVSLKDLPDIYRSADLYVSASHSDGSSVSLMEALACGVPVLVSKIPGNLEWITNDKNGWIFRDGDMNDLTSSMIALSRRKDLAKVAKNCRALAVERADWSRNSQKLLQAYDLAMKVKGKAK